ncbi:MAG: glycosyltransferase family 2 protein [Pirellulaceae bacterium]
MRDSRHPLTPDDDHHDAQSRRFAELAEALRDAPPDVDRVELLEQLLGVEACRRLGVQPIPADFVLSVVIPVFNEAGTVARVVENVRQAVPASEIILVDDGSTDGTPQVLAQLSRQFDADCRKHPEARLKIVRHARNRGKGAAVRTGLAHVTGDAVVIQDADLEYNPYDLPLLLSPLLDGRADVVYGTRFAGASRRVTSLWHRAGNALITLLSNLATGLSLTDVETCYKLFRRDVIQEITPLLRESGFGIEIEITARLARRRVRFVEQAIGYNARGYGEGKKIGWRDAVRALWCILRY